LRVKPSRVEGKEYNNSPIWSSATLKVKPSRVEGKEYNYSPIWSSDTLRVKPSRVAGRLRVQGLTNLELCHLESESLQSGG
jgi:hypothetical protein